MHRNLLPRSAGSVTRSRVAAATRLDNCTPSANHRAAAHKTALRPRHFRLYLPPDFPQRAGNQTESPPPMKTPRSLSTTRNALVLAACLLASNGCDQPQPPQATPTPAPVKSEPARPAPSKSAGVSAEKNSFSEVTAHLDPGGNIYLYLSTEQFLENLSKSVSDWRQLAKSVPDLGVDPGVVDKGFDIAARLIKNSGVEEISGVGMSSIAREKGYYHSKFMVHHYPGKGSGYMWSLFGAKPHALDVLDLLPASTALASSMDFDLPAAWSVIEKELAQLGIPVASERLRSAIGQLEQMSGMKFDQFLAALGSEFTFVLTLDDSKKITVPLPSGTSIEIPEPGLMIMLKVKNDALFNLLDQTLAGNPQVTKTDSGGAKIRSMPLPLPLPIAFRPTIARSGDYLFFATTEALVQDALAAKGGKKPGLKASSEFKKLSADVPLQGNNFMFASERFGPVLAQIQKASLPSSPTDPTGAVARLLGARQPAALFAVSSNTEEGWLTTANGNQSTASLVVGPAIALPVGMLAAIAIPNFVKARSTAQRNACIANLKQLDGATQQWAVEAKKAATAVPTDADIFGAALYIRAKPLCPLGGIYTFGSVADGPRCSIPGHTLKP